MHRFVSRSLLVIGACVALGVAGAPAGAGIIAILIG